VRVEELVERLVRDRSLTGATLSRPRSAEPETARRVTIDPVTLRSGPQWHVRRHFDARTTGENLEGPALAELLRVAIGGTYRQALLHEQDADWQVLAGRGEPRVLRRPPTRPAASGEHDRAKRHLLPEGEPVPFLVALGVQTADGRCAHRGGRSSGRSTGSSSSWTTSSLRSPMALCGSWTSAPGART
jgi:hypothetical protein